MLYFFIAFLLIKNSSRVFETWLVGLVETAGFFFFFFFFFFYTLWNKVFEILGHLQISKAHD